MSVFHPTETEHRAECTNQFKTETLYFELFSFKGRIMARKCLSWRGGGVGLLGTSHNLSWRGGRWRRNLGAFNFFLDGIWGALKYQKMTLAGLQVSFK